jgi:hypothetical protein
MATVFTRLLIQLDRIYIVTNCGTFHAARQLEKAYFATKTRLTVKIFYTYAHFARELLMEAVIAPPQTRWALSQVRILYFIVSKFYLGAKI